MTPRQLEEYRVLRDTIRQRATVKVWVFGSGLLAWSALAMAVWLSNAPPVVSLVPLVALWAAFEAVFSVHTGVERIGRYIQVFFEAADDPGWEHRIMAFGPARASRAEMDGLFSIVFIVATFVNLLPTVVVGPTPIELGVLGLTHVIVLARVLVARVAAAGQRARDLDAFRMQRN